MFLLRFFKKLIYSIFTSIIGVIGAILWGAGQILYGLLIGLCFFAEKTCVFWCIVPWIVDCSVGWKIVNFIVILLILSILIDLQDKVI
jgi:hypothetical protein